MIHHITTRLSTIHCPTHTFSLDGLVQGVQTRVCRSDFLAHKHSHKKSSIAALGIDYDMHDRLRDSSIKDRVIQSEGKTSTCL
jgi:hypothetical protein